MIVLIPALEPDGRLVELVEALRVRPEAFPVLVVDDGSGPRWNALFAAVRAAGNAIQVYGGAGYVDEHPAEKYLRDARVMTLYEGTSQIQKLLIGRAETGVSAFV